MIPKISMFLLLLLTACSGYCQKFDLGKVSVGELLEKKHPVDSAAPAAVLYNKAMTSFYYKRDGFSVVHEFEVRIKIYKKEGFDYANYEVPAYIGYTNINPEYVTVSDGVTYNLENGKIVKTRLTGDGTFKQKVNDNWRTITIAMPNVKEGSIVEFKYTLKSENLTAFPNFRFQWDIPVNYVFYKTEVPVYYQYKTLVNGLIPIKSDSKLGMGQQTILNEHNQSVLIDYKQVVSTHEATWIAALYREDYTDNINNYRSSIDHELEMIRLPSVPDKDLTQTWESLAKTIYADDDFGKQLLQKGYFEVDLRRILDGIETRDDKVAAIFNYVKTRMRWNKNYGIFTKSGLKKAYDAQSGNVAEINLLLVSMLNSAGILADPVLLSTINNGIVNYPNRTAFNYVVASIERDGKPFLLDATDKYAAPGLLPPYAMNWDGRLIHKDGSSETIPLVPATVSRETVSAIAQIDATGIVSGKARIIKNEHLAYNFREKYTGMNREAYLEILENSMPGLRVSNYVLENEALLSNPIQETFDFSSDNSVEIIGDKMYFNPLLLFARTKSPFVQDKRQLPVFFGFPRQSRYSVTIAIPEGYEIESVPEPIAIATGEGVATFRFNIDQQGGKLQISVTAEVNQMLVSAEFYPVIKDYFSKMTQKLKEKVVLKRKM